MRSVYFIRSFLTVIVLMLSVSISFASSASNSSNYSYADKRIKTAFLFYDYASRVTIQKYLKVNGYFSGAMLGTWGDELLNALKIIHGNNPSKYWVKQNLKEILEYNSRCGAQAKFFSNNNTIQINGPLYEKCLKENPKCSANAKLCSNSSLCEKASYTNSNVVKWYSCLLYTSDAADE